VLTLVLGQSSHLGVLGEQGEQGGGADAAASPARTDALASGDVYVVQKKEMPWRVASISGGTSAWVSDGALLPVSSNIMVQQIAIKMKMGVYGGVLNAIFHEEFNGDVNSC